jgi:hypothetical protein
MNLEPAPRLSKTTFLLIDAGLLVVAFIIAYFAKDPYAPLPFISAVLLVAAAAVVGLIPFLVDYAADSAEYVQAERERVAEQVQRLHAAGESLARAAAQIKAVEEAVHKTAHAAENLPYRMQEKLAEFNQQLAQTDDEEKARLTEELEALRSSESERLQAIADKIHKATTDWAALEVATRKQLGAAEAALAKVQAATAEAAAKFETKVTAALSALDAKVTRANDLTAPPFRIAAPVAATPAPTAAAAEAAEVRKEEAAMTDDGDPNPPHVEPAPAPLIESVTITEPATASPISPEPAERVIEEPKPKKPRAPRKPKTEEAAPAAEAPATTDGEPAFNDTPAASAENEEPPDLSAEAPAKTESAASSDGATRLLATAYIGIGNKLFIRGDGPGLSWDKGVPMQFVSIGKWGWATHDATAPVTCKLYKNDETAALTGEVLLEPGKHVEVTALF